jgi:predicted double-glycine peptidase
MTKGLFYFMMVCLMAGCTSHKTNLLDFPNTRQSFEYSCGPGAVQSVMANYSDNFREYELIALMNIDKNEGAYLKDIV